MVLDGIAFAARRTPSGYNQLPRVPTRPRGRKKESEAKGVEHAAGDRHRSREKRTRQGSSETRGDEVNNPTLPGSDRSDPHHAVPDSRSAEPAEESSATARGPAGKWVHVPA